MEYLVGSPGPADIHGARGLWQCVQSGLARRRGGARPKADLAAVFHTFRPSHHNLRSYVLQVAVKEARMPGFTARLPLPGPTAGQVLSTVQRLQPWPLTSPLHRSLSRCLSLYPPPPYPCIPIPQCPSTVKYPNIPIPQYPHSPIPPPWSTRASFTGAVLYSSPLVSPTPS
jgi:hypothetical protein